MGYNWILVISLVYTAPFLAVLRARETAMAELSATVRTACKLVVAQFRRAKDHEIINEGAVVKYVWSELETRCSFRTTTS